MKPIHTLWVDSDPFLYLAAHKAQPKCYWVGEADFNTQKEAIEYANEWAPELINDIKKEEFLCSPKQARKYLHQCIDKSLGVYTRWFNKNLAKKYELDIIFSISSKSSFRKDIYLDYKGTRPPKPRWYELLRAAFIDQYQPIIKDGMEADDVVAEGHYKLWKQDPNSTCIASLDKDLYNIPGIHFNTQKNSVAEVTPMEAIYTFCTQMLTGDTSDNIKAVPRVGPKTAEKLLDTLINFSSPKDYFMYMNTNVISPQYVKAFGDEATQRSALNFKLLDVGQVYEKEFKLKGIDKRLKL